jgi:hypothetical protein
MVPLADSSLTFQFNTVYSRYRCSVFLIHFHPKLSQDVNEERAFNTIPRERFPPDRNISCSGFADSADAKMSNLLDGSDERTRGWYNGQRRLAAADHPRSVVVADNPISY